jgi:hypothetical protein
MSNRIFSISLHLQDEKGNFRDAPSVPLIAVIDRTIENAVCHALLGFDRQ